MSAQTAIYVGPPAASPESSMSSAAEGQVQKSDADVSPIDWNPDSNPNIERRTDFVLSDSSASPTSGISLLPSSSRSPVEISVSSPYLWPNTDNASMHSDQDFDLGYKAKPAEPFCYKVHTRVWSSVYTRPAADMCREILMVRYPVREASDEEIVGLLSGWTRGPRGLFLRNL